MYLAWVKSGSEILQTLEKVKRIASYDNYFSTSPHRFIEFEFDNMTAATKYFARKEIRRFFEDLPNHLMNHNLILLKLRGDYTKR